MTTFVFIIVLAAAALHATWNAVVKGGNDKQLNMLAVVLGHALPALVLLPFVKTPESAGWPYIVVGMLLHFGYQLFLLRAYQSGDLTQVYPIARGSAPLLVAVISVVFLGVTLGNQEIAAVILIAAGIFSICLVRQQSGIHPQSKAKDPAARNPAVMLALITGGFIASYSLVDGIGARLAGTALGFYCWLTMGNVLLMLAATRFMRKGLLTDLVSRGKSVCLWGGGASFLAYALVIWSFTQAPIALVTALRETSIVFALLIGVLHLKEKLSLAKVLSTMTTLTGVVLLRFAP